MVPPARSLSVSDTGGDVARAWPLHGRRCALLTRSQSLTVSRSELWRFRPHFWGVIAKVLRAGPLRYDHDTDHARPGYRVPVGRGVPIGHRSEDVTRSWLGDAAAYGLDGCLDAVVEVKFCEDAGDVVVDGVGAERELVRDVVIGSAAGEPFEDL